jgi:ferritin-like metal-binding protein YciE
MAKNELLISWLKDAYSMEKALIPVLENHADDAKDYPEVRERDLRHAEETRRHMDLVEECLERLGEEPSTAKTVLGDLMGRVQAVTTAPFKDELMKNFLSDYAAEHFEIACYKALIAASRASGEPEIAATCEEILRDEEEMARWLDSKMEWAAQESLRKHSA